ncbi:MAG: class I SAM-dependent methyltransferase [Thermoguttaceae bacterium]|nr:class I SAM-dependent methyltransferase [Thermoguttaceae bacterium]
MPYARHHRFQEVMVEQSAQTVVAALTDSILPLVPGAIDDLRRGIDMLDVGCGAGRAINLLGCSFPNSRFTGYALCPEAVERWPARNRGIGA